jgi:hypothetical protein
MNGNSRNILYIYIYVIVGKKKKKVVFQYDRLRAGLAAVNVWNFQTHSSELIL